MGDLSTIDAGSNLSKTVDRSRPVRRVCRRTWPVQQAAWLPGCLAALGRPTALQHCSTSRYAGPGPQHLVCCRWCWSNTRLSGLPTCLVCRYLNTHVQACLGITTIHDRATAIERGIYCGISSDPTCTSITRLCRQPAPAPASTSWLGCRGPCSNIPGLNLDRARFQSCIPGKNPPLLQLHNGCHVCIGSVTLIEPARSSKLSETIKSPGAGPARRQAPPPPYHLTRHKISQMPPSWASHAAMTVHPPGLMKLQPLSN